MQKMIAAINAIDGSTLGDNIIMRHRWYSAAVNISPLPVTMNGKINKLP